MDFGERRREISLVQQPSFEGSISPEMSGTVFKSLNEVLGGLDGGECQEGTWFSWDAYKTSVSLLPLYLLGFESCVETEKFSSLAHSKSLGGQTGHM